MYKTDIEIHHIFSSPEHHYFTREKFDVGDAPTIEHKSVKLKAGKGLDKDRFEFSKYPITFFSLEVAKELSKSLGIELDLKLYRRNIIISGINLNSLIGKKFKIDDVEFEGIAHCAPCTWMNSVMKKGAYSLMVGRGGLRAKVVNSGVLKICKTSIYTKEILNINPLDRIKKPSIP